MRDLAGIADRAELIQVRSQRQRCVFSSSNGNRLSGNAARSARASGCATSMIPSPHHPIFARHPHPRRSRPRFGWAFSVMLGQPFARSTLASLARVRLAEEARPFAASRWRSHNPDYDTANSARLSLIWNLAGCQKEPIMLTQIFGSWCLAEIIS